MSSHPDGTGTGWTLVETVDVDQPHGLDWRGYIHLAKAVRKRIEQEHVSFADNTVGGAHTPGYCQVLRQVDGTADVTTAKDNTLFQNNGLAYSYGNQTLWCISGAASDPTVLLLDPDKQYKGGDITWTGAQQFDASVDMTILKCVSGTFQILVVESSANLHGPVDMSDTDIDGTLTVLDRADFSSVGISGDSTITGVVEFDGAVDFDGAVTMDSSCQVNGLMSFCANNVYDSTWFVCERGTGYTKTHDLSSTALQLFLFFKDSANGFSLGADRIYNCYAYSVSGEDRGATINNVTTTQLTVQSGQNAVAETFTAAGVNVTCNSGHYRIIAMRLV